MASWYKHIKTLNPVKGCVLLADPQYVKEDDLFREQWPDEWTNTPVFFVPKLALESMSREDLLVILQRLLGKEGA